MAEVSDKITTSVGQKSASAPNKNAAPGLTVRRFFTKPGQSAFDQVEWELRTASITDASGGTIFEQKNVEVPKDWSMTATNIVASKYLHGAVGTPERESGVRALITRVADIISNWGYAQGYFRTDEAADAFAGVIKSGGKTRRAAKMVILNVEHPDIVEFIDCKMKEEAKAWTLMQAGYDGSSPDSEAYSSIFFQNANNSVRVTDEFMHAVEKDSEFFTKAIKDGRPVKQFRARDLMNKIAEATWQCGDPGMQYDTTVNKWHTSKNTGRINASNPCSEYMFLDDSACNLASLNLMKFAPNGQFDIEAYKHAVDITITAQEILVDNSGYPTEAIGRNSHDYRPLGLGYANLGALLMAAGLPYDSDGGRDYAACVTAIMCGQAYLQSARIAEQCPALAPATELTSRAAVEA